MPILIPDQPWLQGIGYDVLQSLHFLSQLRGSRPFRLQVAQEVVDSS